MPVLTPTPNPGFPDIYELAIDDPVAGGPDGIDNLPHKQLAERTAYLRVQQDAFNARLVDQADRLAAVEGSAGSATGRALPLSWRYSDRGFDFELFASGADWRMFAPVAVTQAVAGDDSVDVASTAALEVGRSYVLIPPVGADLVVTVAAILSATRFTVTGPVGRSVAGGTLARSNWDIQPGHAIAPDGGVLFSRRIDTLRYYADEGGRLIVRRDAGDGVVSVAYRRLDTVVWTPGTLLGAEQVQASTRDETWAIGGGVVELRITTAHGPSASDTRIDHMVVLTAPRAGLALIVDQPVLVSPANGAAAVANGTPTLTASAYKSLYGRAHATSQWQIATDADFTQLVFDNLDATAPLTSVTVTAGSLAINTLYRWRVRYRDEDGVWSPWSVAFAFSTGALFNYIAKPVNIAPGVGATGVALQPTLQCSAFAVGAGDDIHATSCWQVATSPSFSAIVYNSGDSGDKTSHTVPAALTALTGLWWRVRHKGETIGYSDWSTPTAFTTQAVPGAPAITSPGNGAVGTILAPMLQSSAFFVPGGDNHAASQWQIAATATFAALVHDSGSAAALTSYTPPALTPMTTYYVRVRHFGTATGWGPYSAVSSFTTGVAPGQTLFTAPGVWTFTVPPNVFSVCAAVGAAGAGGGPSAQTGGSSGGGGGSGGSDYRNDIAVVPGQQILVTVGQGGAPGVGNATDLSLSTDGAPGGSSSFGSFVSAGGAGGGKAYARGAGGGAGGGGRYPGNSGQAGTNSIGGPGGARSGFPSGWPHGGAGAAGQNNGLGWPMSAGEDGNVFVIWGPARQFPMGA